MFIQPTPYVISIALVVHMLMLLQSTAHVKHFPLVLVFYLFGCVFSFFVRLTSFDTICISSNIVMSWSNIISTSMIGCLLASLKTVTSLGQESHFKRDSDWVLTILEAILEAFFVRLLWNATSELWWWKDKSVANISSHYTTLFSKSP